MFVYLYQSIHLCTEEPTKILIFYENIRKWLSRIIILSGNARISSKFYKIKLIYECHLLAFSLTIYIWFVATISEKFYIFLRKTVVYDEEILFSKSFRNFLILKLLIFIVIFYVLIK